MGNFFTNPFQYLHSLTKQQKDIIKSHCPLFMDVKYIVKNPITFILNEKEYTVNRGFVCDGVSSGFILSNLIDLDTAIMHDFLYATHPESKDICDTILEPWYRRYIVGIFGDQAWQSSGHRGALIINQIGGEQSDETQTGSVWLNVYHTPDYSQISQQICLTEEESSEFTNFF